MPVARKEKLVFDELAIHHDLAAAQKTGNGKGGGGGDKYHRDARNDARHAQRQLYLAEHLEGIGPQILRRLNELRLHFGEDGVDGQDHKRQEIVYQADDDGGGVVQ